MYQRFFGLKESPFNVNPDPRYLYLTRRIQEALAGLTYGIQNRKGFILLTGEVGTGKTTLLNRLLDWLHGQRMATAYIFNSRQTHKHRSWSCSLRRRSMVSDRFSRIPASVPTPAPS